MTAPQLEFAFEIRAQVGPPLDVGPVAGGRRRIIQILGGTFEGSGMKGHVLPGGADWQIVRADGLAELDTRYTLETDDGVKLDLALAGERIVGDVTITNDNGTIKAKLDVGRAK